MEFNDITMDQMFIVTFIMICRSIGVFVGNIFCTSKNRN